MGLGCRTPGGTPVPTSRLAALLAAAALAAGCDYAWDLDVTVTVPPATQAAVASWPQQVLVRYLRPGSTSSAPVYRMAVLCSASAEPFTAHVHFDSLGPRCSPVYQVESWLTAADPVPGLACGPVDSPGAPLNPDGSVLVPAPGEPVGSALAFDGGCARADAVSLTLGAAAP